MKVLVVEDSPERIKWFKQQLVGVVYDICETPVQAIHFLRTRGPYTHIFLDHDLAEEHYLLKNFNAVNPDTDTLMTGTGQDVARYLRDHATCCSSAVIILHTMNYNGGLRMLGIMKEGDRSAAFIPYPRLQQSLVEKGLTLATLTEDTPKIIPVNTSHD